MLNFKKNYSKNNIFLFKILIICLSIQVLHFNRHCDSGAFVAAAESPQAYYLPLCSVVMKHMEHLGLLVRSETEQTHQHFHKRNIFTANLHTKKNTLGPKNVVSMWKKNLPHLEKKLSPVDGDIFVYCLGSLVNSGCLFCKLAEENWRKKKNN